MKAPSLILASTSPRRRELLARLGIPFTVKPADIDESPLPGERPEATALRVAREKAETVARTSRGQIILAADTIVVLDDAILGKPEDAHEAARMLRALRARGHLVITGIALLNRDNGRECLATVSTKVWMRDYDEREITDYIRSGDPFDKAGAYAIQNRSFHPVERIEGCYNNVVGLPICEVAEGLVQVGYPNWAPSRDEIERLCPHAGPQGRLDVSRS